MKHLDSNSTNKRANQRAGASRRTRLALTLAGALSCAALAAPAANANHDDTPHSAGDPDRAFELVSPSYKIAGIGAGVGYTGPGSASQSGFAAYERERFAVQGTWGSTLLESAFSFANDWAFAERKDAQAGWVSHSPVTRGGYGSQNYRFLVATAANDDLSLLSWASNGGGQLRLFPEQEAWDGTPLSARAVTAVSDWTGNWELFAPTDPSQAASGGGSFGMFRALGIAGAAPVVAGSGEIGGLAGAGDPTHPVHGDLVDGETVYVDDLSAGVSDTFPGAGVRSVANVCTGTGPARTEIPVVLTGGALGAQACPPPLPGRDARLISDHGASMGAGTSSPVSLKDVVSRDGSRVFFMSPDPGADALISGSPCGTVGDNCPPQLYVWQRNPDGTVVTRWLSRPEVSGQAATLLGQARFEGASEDGSRVFFRTASPLTADDPNGEGVAPPAGGVVTGSASDNSWDLYMYELPTAPGADPGDGDLTRLSAGPAGGGAGDCNSPGADGGNSEARPAALRFVSRDGARVYFTCASPLADVAGSSDPSRAPGRATPAGNPTTPVPADTNLYLYDANQAAEAQRWKFITRLPRSRDAVIAACASTGPRNVDLLGATGGSGGDVGILTVTRGEVNCLRGRSDGGFVTFWTDGSLTVDDGADGVSGDMYGYDVASDDLVRLSAPEGPGVSGYTCLTSGSEAGKQCFGDPGLGMLDGKASLGVVTDPVVGSDRVAFFQSRSRLVAGDADDAYDVYEWRNGDLSLVSTGASDTDGAFYRGNDRSGRNVFFATQDALTWQDIDAVVDVYSARVGGGIARPAVPAACVVLADACQGGGAGLAPVAPKSVAPGGGDASPGVRRRLSIGRLGARARRRAARSGVLRLRVKTNSAGVLRAGVRARVGKRSRRVAVARKRVARPGRVLVRLRLSAGARRVLREQRVLRVTVRVAQQGARGRTATVTLRRGKRS